MKPKDINDSIWIHPPPPPPIIYRDIKQFAELGKEMNERGLKSMERQAIKEIIMKCSEYLSKL